MCGNNAVVIAELEVSFAQCGDSFLVAVDDAGYGGTECCSVECWNACFSGNISFIL